MKKKNTKNAEMRYKSNWFCQTLPPYAIVSFQFTYIPNTENNKTQITSFPSYFPKTNFWPSQSLEKIEVPLVVSIIVIKNA